jgi:hypothetical protein
MATGPPPSVRGAGRARLLSAACQPAPGGAEGRLPARCTGLAPPAAPCVPSCPRPSVPALHAPLAPRALLPRRPSAHGPGLPPVAPADAHAVNPVSRQGRGPQSGSLGRARLAVAWRRPGRGRGAVQGRGASPPLKGSVPWAGLHGRRAARARAAVSPARGDSTHAHAHAARCTAAAAGCHTRRRCRPTRRSSSAALW